MRDQDIFDVVLNAAWDLVKPVVRPVRRFIYFQEIAALAREYKARTGRDPKLKAANAEAGSFHTQLVRLFTVGNAAETGELQRLATGAITSCQNNRYYLLGDVLDALESWTFIGDAPDGEAPLDKLDDQWRRLKIDTVRKAYLVPLKIAFFETVLGGYADSVGRSLPYAALGRFERQVSRVFALLDESETTWMESELSGLLEQWKEDKTFRRRFREPASAVAKLVDAYDGRRPPRDLPSLRVRRAGQPLRLSTLEPSCRQDLLDAAIREVRSVATRSSESGGPAEADAPAPVSRPVKSRVRVPSTASRRAARPRAAPRDAPASEETRVSIALGCPKCGAPFTVNDEVVSLDCGYCNSLLVLSAPERQEIYREEANLEGSGQILEAFIEARVAERRMEVEARYQNENGELSVPELVVDGEVKLYEQRLRETSRIGELHRIHIPYWHLVGKIVQGALGFWKEGAKALRIRAFEVEHTLPAYDTARDNFRDRGLRLGQSRLKPLTAEDVQTLSAFVAWAPIPDETYREVQKWCNRTLETSLDPLSKHGEFLFSRRFLVYRLAWLARIVGEEPQWLIVDGTNGNIGGYPDASEIEAALGRLVADPIGSGEESFKAVHVVAARCPNCGVEQHPDSRFSFVVCTSCHTGLEPRPGAIASRAYHHAGAERGDGDLEYLPFWRFGFQLGLAAGSTVTTLDEYYRALFPDLSGEGGPTGDALWVPAFRFLGTPEGDQAWKALVEWVHAHPPRVVRGRIPQGSRARSWGVSLPQADASSLGRFVLLALHSRQSAARMNSARLRQGVVEAKLELGEPDLVMVPVGREGDRCVLPDTGVSFPTLLLEGGPQLDALRATVHGLV